MSAHGVELLEEPELARESGLAPQWKVILHDDPTTTMDFVVQMLVALFRKAPGEAERLMLEVHRSGSALITVTTLERGELYVEQIRSLARPRGYPLTATLEPA